LGFFQIKFKRSKKFLDFFKSNLTAQKNFGIFSNKICALKKVLRFFQIKFKRSKKFWDFFKSNLNAQKSFGIFSNKI
jgi:hypothetical protein